MNWTLKYLSTSPSNIYLGAPDSAHSLEYLEPSCVQKALYIPIHLLRMSFLTSHPSYSSVFQPQTWLSLVSQEPTPFSDPPLPSLISWVTYILQVFILQKLPASCQMSLSSSEMQVLGGQGLSYPGHHCLTGTPCKALLRAGAQRMFVELIN